MSFFTCFLFLVAPATLVICSELTTDSSYGERLAESYVFNSVSTRDQSKDESAYAPGISAILNSDGFLNTMTKYNNEPKYTPNGPVEAAVHTKKTFEVIPVKFEEPPEGEPQVIEISPYEVPLSILFKTQTNKINVNQEHKSETPEEVPETTSEEEPQRLKQNIFRPIIHEVTEVIQPYRKLMQRVEPVIEEMKTIITKAGPPEGNTSQKQQNYESGGKSYSSSNRHNTQDENRFSRYGGNDLGRGLSIIPMSYGSASEVIKKLSDYPQSEQSTENEMSRRFGMSNRNRPEDQRNFKNRVHDDKETPLDSKATRSDYNDIITDYISKFLEPKPAASNQSTQKIYPNSIKVFNVPMKNMPTPNAKNSKGEGEKPKFKIIKEFKVTLDDLRKLKLAPFVMPSKNGHGKSNVSQQKGAFRPNFSPSASGNHHSFKPMVHLESKSPNKVFNNSNRRMGEMYAPAGKHIATLSRRSSHDRPINLRPRHEQKPALNGISPPNLMFGSQKQGPPRPLMNRSHIFRRSDKDQEFFDRFEPKRLHQ